MEQRTDVFEPRFGHDDVATIGSRLAGKRIADNGASSDATSAKTTIAPPAGWEEPPAITKVSTKSKDSPPACCGFDKLCCARQSDIDRGIPDPAIRSFDVRFSDIPEATIKEATKEAAVEGAPPIRVVDGTGAPFPWRDGPQQFEIRIIPQGTYGFLRFGKDSSAAHYDKPELRSLGYGLTVPINPTPDRGRSLLMGPIEYWLFSRGDGGTVIHDHVKGKLQGSPDIITERWVHVAAIDIAEGIVHAYRTLYDDKPHVFFLLPEVIVGFESKNAKSFGGTENDRFASDFPYTLYRFPLGPGHSDTMNCTVQEYEIKRWFARSKNAMKLPANLRISLSMSQTSVESEAHVRVVFLRVPEGKI